MQCERAHIQIAAMNCDVQIKGAKIVGKLKVTCDRKDESQFSFEITMFERNDETFLGVPKNIVLNNNFREYLKDILKTKLEKKDEVTNQVD